MAKLSPYRSLPAARRAELIAHAARASKDLHALYIQRLTAKGGGFRPQTLRTWPVDRLAKEVVRLGAETPQDEFDLLHLLYVELDPSIQTTFRDAAGVKHENGRIPEELEPPYADAAAVEKASAAVQARHGDDGVRYLRTLARYGREGWPGIEGVAAQFE